MDGLTICHKDGYTIPNLQFTAAGIDMPSNSNAHSEMDAPRRADVAVVLRVGLGLALAADGVEALSAVALGCLVALHRHTAGRPAFAASGSRMSLLDGKVALSMRGVQASELDLIFAALAHTSAVRLDAECIVLPHLDEALQIETKKLAARVAGWKSRLAVRGDAGAVLATAHPAMQPKSLAPVSASAPVKSIEPPKSLVPKPSGPVVRRVGVEGVEEPGPDDVTAVRLLCKDGVAELTASYVAYLQAHYKRVDVEQEMRTAALWCESNTERRKTTRRIRSFICNWLSRANESADVRSMVVRANSSRNGFGQGGSYGAEQSATATGRDLVDDLADLSSVSQDVAPNVVSMPAVRVNPVLAARARSRPAASTAQRQQRRLSEVGLG